MTLALLGTYSTLIEANFIKAKLETFGIDAVVHGDVAASTIPTLEMTEGIKVLVRESNLAEAFEVLERMLPSGD